MFSKRTIRHILKTVRPHHLMVAFAVVFFVVSSIAVYDYPSKLIISDIATTTQTAISGPVLSQSLPVRISIPKLHIDADFEAPLGVTQSKEIEVPKDYESVGYYKYGPTPGELGPAVVLGHVDSVAGPAVFYSLGQLDIGDEINIEREDGRTVTFTVTKMERHPQSGFPTEEVYGNIDHAGLRLITCSGVFNKGVQRYSHNLIVFAKLKEE